VETQAKLSQSLDQNKILPEHIEAMKAYKFRGEDQTSFAFDVIFNNRLYCASWRELNDTLEGKFTAIINFGDKAAEKHLKKVLAAKYPLRLCSLSATCNQHLLWSHYATGFRGLALELELPENPEIITGVTYRKEISEEILIETTQPEESIARKILSSKFNEWDYEAEIRILQKEQWYEFGSSSRVTKIICGHRMKDGLFKAVKMIGNAKGIPVSKTTIEDSGIELVDCSESD
jgi:hypothetical protein